MSTNGSLQLAIIYVEKRLRLFYAARARCTQFFRKTRPVHYGCWRCWPISCRLVRHAHKWLLSSWKVNWFGTENQLTFNNLRWYLVIRWHERLTTFRWQLNAVLEICNHSAVSPKTVWVCFILFCFLIFLTFLAYRHTLNMSLKCPSAMQMDETNFIKNIVLA